MSAQPNLNKSSKPNNVRTSSRAHSSVLNNARKPSPPKSSPLQNSRPSSTSSTPHAPTPDGRCHHHRADGKRCASATYPGHTSLCHHHLSRQMRGISDGDTVAADILSSIGNFQSATAINIALGKLFVHQITGRISRQDALALAYNCQLLLQTLPALKAEIRDSGYAKYWKEETQRILAGPSDLEAITAPSLLPPSPFHLHPPDRHLAAAPAAPKPNHAAVAAAPARPAYATHAPATGAPSIPAPAPPTAEPANTAASSPAITSSAPAPPPRAPTQQISTPAAISASVRTPAPETQSHRPVEPGGDVAPGRSN